MNSVSTTSGHKVSTIILKFMWLILVIFSAAVSLWWVITTAAVATDSLIYLKIGRLFFSEHHAQVSADFPPLYSLALELIMLLGIQPTLAAKLLNLLLLCGSTTLLYKILTLSSGIRRTHAAVIALLVMTTYIVVRTHTYMLSESLFIFLVFCNFYWLLRYAKQNTFIFLGLAAFFASLAALSRYAGVAVIVSTVVTAWLLTPKLNFARMQKTVLICAVSSTLFALWLARNYLLKSSLTGRQTNYLERESLGLLHYADIFTQLYFPTAVPLMVRLVCFGLLILLLVLTIIVVAKHSRNSPHYPIMLMSFTAASLQLLLILVIWFIDSSLPIKPRILAPTYSLIVLMHFVALAYWASRFHQIKVVVVIYLFMYMLMNSSRIVILSQQPRNDYNNPKWGDSEVIQYWNNEKYNSIYIASNAYDVLGYHLNREIHRLPFMFSYRTKKAFADFPQKMHNILCQMAKNKGYIVYLNAKNKRTHLPSPSQLLEDFPLIISHQFNDGVALEVEEAYLLNCKEL